MYNIEEVGRNRDRKMRQGQRWAEEEEGRGTGEIRAKASVSSWV